MILISRRRNKIAGSILIIFGIFCIYYWQSFFSFPLFILIFVAALGSIDMYDIKPYQIVSILLALVIVVWRALSFFAGLIL